MAYTVSFYNINRIGLFFLLAAMLVPLELRGDYYVLTTWNIPFFALLFTSAVGLLYRPKLELSHGWEWAIALFGLLFLLNTIGRPHAPANTGQLLQYLLALLLAVYIRRVWNHHLFPSTLANFAFFAVLLQAAVMLFQVVTASPFGYIGAYVGAGQLSMIQHVQQGALGRALGTVGQANIAANWLVALLPFVMLRHYLTFGLPEAKGRHGSILLPLVLLAAIAALLCTFSRGNIAIFVLIGLMIACWRLAVRLSCPRMPRFRVASLAMAAVLVLGGIAVVGLNAQAVRQVQQTLQQRVALTTQDWSEGSVNYRMQMNRGAWQAFRRAPLRGIGYQNTAHMWPSLSISLPPHLQRRVHNIYVAFLAEGGLFCGLLYGVILFYPLMRMVRFWSSLDQLKYPLLLGLLACSLFPLLYVTPTMPGFAPLHMLLLGAAMGYVDQNRATGQEAKPCVF